MAAEPVEIKPSEKTKIRYAGKDFEITNPKVGYLRAFNKRMGSIGKEGSTDNEVDLMCEFCESAGVPVDVVNSMDVPELAQLIKIIGGDAEKKT